MFEKFMEKFKKPAPAADNDEMKFKPFTPAQRIEVSASEAEEPVHKQDDETRNGGVEIRVIRPEAFEEVSTVADHLISGCTVVLNVEVLDFTTIQRMLDFLNGVTYCLDGEIKRVSPSTFIIAPHDNIDITDM